MDIAEFIINFKSQLENDNFVVASETDYVKSEFWDSLTNMVINAMLSDEYNIHLSHEELNEFSSVQELFDYVVKNQQ